MAVRIDEMWDALRTMFGAVMGFMLAIFAFFMFGGMFLYILLKVT